jgi:hypothetical protein
MRWLSPRRFGLLILLTAFDRVVSAGTLTRYHSTDLEVTNRLSAEALDEPGDATELLELEAAFAEANYAWGPAVNADMVMADSERAWSALASRSAAPWDAFECLCSLEATPQQAA